MTVNIHGNGMPEKPTAHQTGHPYDNFLRASATRVIVKTSR